MLSLEQIKARFEIEAGQAFEAAERLEVYGAEQIWVEYYGRLPKALLAEAFRKHGKQLMEEVKKYLPSQPVSEELVETERPKEAEKVEEAEEVKEAERSDPPFVPYGRRRRGE